MKEMTKTEIKHLRFDNAGLLISLDLLVIGIMGGLTWAWGVSPVPSLSIPILIFFPWFRYKRITLDEDQGQIRIWTWRSVWDGEERYPIGQIKKVRYRSHFSLASPLQFSGYIEIFLKEKWTPLTRNMGFDDKGIAHKIAQTLRIADETRE